jgi:hypothetical protein
VKIHIRPAVQDDHAFIFATYLRNRWFDKSNATTLRRSTWSILTHNRLEKLLEEGKDIFVACLSEDPSTILGYVLKYETKPYIYIKQSWRSEGLGIRERLLQELEK